MQNFLYFVDNYRLKDLHPELSLMVTMLLLLYLVPDPYFFELYNYLLRFSVDDTIDFAVDYKASNPKTLSLFDYPMA